MASRDSVKLQRRFAALGLAVELVNLGLQPLLLGSGRRDQNVAVRRLLGVRRTAGPCRAAAEIARPACRCGAYAGQQTAGADAEKDACEQQNDNDQPPGLMRVICTGASWVFARSKGTKSDGSKESEMPLGSVRGRGFLLSSLSAEQRQIENLLKLSLKRSPKPCRAEI